GDEECVALLVRDRQLCAVVERVQGRAPPLVRDLPGQGDLRIRRLSDRRSGRRGAALLVRRAQRENPRSRRPGGNDCRSRDDREAGDGGRPWLPSRQRRGALQVTTIKGLRRVLTLRDLVLYFLVTGFSLRWIATAAAAGPSALVIWVIAALGLFVPLVFTVLELSSRYPEEGRFYVWSKRG